MHTNDQPSHQRTGAGRATKPGVKHISLALQGGGSHGAFTWGVMHRLISEPRIYIDGLSGTSAGGMNAAVFADGFLKGKRQGAIDALEAFWMGVSGLNTMPRVLPRGLPGLSDGWNVDSDPTFMWLDHATRMFAPLQLNPMRINPLSDLLTDLVDFENLRRHPQVKLFVTASNVRTCRSRLFRTPEISVEALLASACLPLLFEAVEIDGEYFWDGGYLGNPAIHPLIHECDSSDVVIVQVNPMNRPDVPISARDILNRINEMTFNSSLVREMEGFATITRLIESGELQNDRYTAVRFHEISAEAELADMGALSKMNTERPFLEHLHQLGYETADKWIAENFDRIGWESTLDLTERFG
ncbi:MAG: patatin-like phospholipase family protein [Rhodospirillaceae bacterium]|nr:patatin-like phospholipase family protein [Rhodospirillaceae bacterium]